MHLAIPKLRQGSFFPSFVERRRRIDRALFAVVMEAYVHGVSPRKIDDLFRRLGDVEVRPATCGLAVPLTLHSGPSIPSRLAIVAPTLAGGNHLRETGDLTNAGGPPRRQSANRPAQRGGGHQMTPELEDPRVGAPLRMCRFSPGTRAMSDPPSPRGLSAGA